MDDILRRALTGTAERPTLTFERTYRAGRAELRDACTDPTRLARWFGVITGDPGAVGDRYTALLSEDPDDRAVGAVRRCDESGLAVSWSWQGEPESVITVDFVSVDDEHTTLRLHHALGEARQAGGYGGGWEQLLQALARSLGAADPDTPSDADLETAAAERWRTIARAPLQVEQRLAVSPERVWAAVGSAEGLRTWWWTHWSDVTIEADVRVGGSYRIAAPAAGIVLSGTYLEVDAPHHLAFTWCWRDADGAAPDEAVDLRLESSGSGTRLVVRHSGPWADDGPADSYRQGWAFTLGQLAAVVAGGSAR